MLTKRVTFLSIVENHDSLVLCDKAPETPDSSRNLAELKKGRAPSYLSTESFPTINNAATARGNCRTLEGVRRNGGLDKASKIPVQRLNYCLVLIYRT